MGQAGHRDNDVVGATVPGLSWRQPRAGQGCGDPRGMGNRGPRDILGPGSICLGMAMATHACSCAAWHPRSSLAGTRHSVAPPCCRDSAGSALCAGRTPLGPLRRCCRGTGRAGNARRAAAGPRSTQGHTHHSGDLPAQSAGQRLGTWGPPRALSTQWWALTCVARAAVADDLPRAGVLVAGGGEVAGAARPLRAGAGPAVLPRAQRWVPKVPGCAPARRHSARAGAAGSALPCTKHTPHVPLAPLAVRVVTAAHAAARPGVAVLSMPVALAGPACREAPVAGLAAVAA